MTRRLRQIAQLALVLCPLAVAAPAAAQGDIATAEAIFNRGLADMEAGRYETGCKALAESHRLDPRPGTLFTLATCEARWGRIATAVTRYGDYLSLYQRLTPDQQRRQGERPTVAKQQREKLAPLVPELALSLPSGAPAGTVVKRDGVVLGDAVLGVSVPVDPGEHVVSTEPPGGRPRETRIRLAQGEKKKLVLEVDGAGAPGADGGSGRRAAMFVAGGVGAAGLILGGVMGALTLGKQGVVDKHCGSAIGSTDETACDPTGLEAAESASTTGLVSTIGFGVGLAGLGTAAVLYLTEPKPAAPAAGAAARRIHVGVLEAGPSGVVLGAKGAW
ncbi:tetratricopeptide repeat protein [Sorangium sp. So ce131]|uniref:tetratricopeptide repeat protein n=1 Tax=Sorangium sp. So ce131 TaxID=3133282 RepID=UPI003F5D7FCD